jgi:hypothetical protein
MLSRHHGEPCKPRHHRFKGSPGTRAVERFVVVAPEGYVSEGQPYSKVFQLNEIKDLACKTQT